MVPGTTEMRVRLSFHSYYHFIYLPERQNDSNKPILQDKILLEIALPF